LQILIDKEEIGSYLAAEYELGDISNITHLLASEPDRTDLFKIEGSGKAYALKLQAANKRESQFILEARLLSWLQNNTFALVPPVMLSREGTPFGILNEQHCMVTGFVSAFPVYDWREATWETAVCRRGGESLAQLHNHLAKLTIGQIKDWGYDVADAPPSLANKGRIGVGSVRPRIKMWLNQAIDDFCFRHADRGGAEKRQSLVSEPDSSDPLDLEVCRSLQKKRNGWMELLDSSEATLQEIPEAKKTAMIHGDFHPGNALWSGDRVTAIIDFENSHLEHPLYDVAYSMIMFSARWHRAIAFGSGAANGGLTEDPTEGVTKGQTERQTERQTEGQTEGQTEVRTSFSLELASDFLAGYMKDTHVVSEKDCGTLLRPFLQIAGSVILYWMLIEHRSKACYTNLIEFLVANLEEVSHLAGV
jgi:Ser/Thr protein kinase RdoA (MazF antagonist)